jgi:hypothetical protein
MSDAATVSAVMRELAARRWRGQVPTRLARELLPRVDELPPVERRALLTALTRREADVGQT